MAQRKKAVDFFSVEDESNASEVESLGETEQVRGTVNLLEESGGEHDNPKDEVEESRVSLASKKRKHRLEDEEDQEDERNGDEQDKLDKNASDKRNNRVKPLSSKKLEKNLEKLKRSGVVYISRIPPYMKPVKLRQILARFGEVNRIFLTPEDPKVYARRVKSGGNKKKNYTEGWAEYLNKKDAKLAAATLNGNKIGGKKGSYYYDDILNVKYLHKFKWNNLTEQIALENQARQEKLKAEISQATRENKIFMENVEAQKMITKIEEKRAEKSGKTAPRKIRRTFDQKDVFTKRAGETNVKKETGSKISGVLHLI